MSDVFVSYKAEDRERVAPLVEALETEGVTVWWDAHIGGGTNWHEDIVQHLDAAKCVIVAWSKRSVGHGGHFVRDEARRAQRRGAYMPVCLDPIEPPLGFGEIQAISLKGWKGDRADSRFQAVVHAVRSHVSGEHVARPHIQFRQPRLTRRVAIAGGIGIGAIAVAGTGGWLLLKPAPTNVRRIAVMPFANMSSDQEQAYFADGIAEELRAALSRIGLEVIGRASSEAVMNLDTKAAASKLGVTNILTGSVRRSSEMIRVNAQLVDGYDGVERWAQSYDRAPGDAIKIQSDIAAKVAQALSFALGKAGRAALALGGTTDSAAQDLVLQAREVWRSTGTPEGYQQALALIEAAVVRDPNYAEALVDKSRLLSTLAANSTSAAETAERLNLSEAAAREALAVAPAFGPAHAALSGVEQVRLNFQLALKYLERARALSRDDPTVLTESIFLLPYIGSGQEALRIADRVIALDPLNTLGYRRKAVVLYTLRQYPRAIEVARKALEMAPENIKPNVTIGLSLLLIGRPRDALGALRLLPANDAYRLAGEALAAARIGETANAEKWASELWAQYGSGFGYLQAEIRAQLGQKERAFVELNKALVARDPGLLELKTDPFLDPIRRDPRFAAIAAKLNFP